MRVRPKAFGVVAACVQSIGGVMVKCIARISVFRKSLFEICRLAPVAIDFVPGYRDCVIERP